MKMRKNRSDGSGFAMSENIAYLDDASRMVLAGEEFYEINTENLKLVVDQLAYKY